MKKLTFVFLLLALSVCGVEPLNVEGIRIATLACEPYKGVLLMVGIDRDKSGYVTCVAGNKFYINENGVIK